MMAPSRPGFGRLWLPLLLLLLFAAAPLAGHGGSSGYILSLVSRVMIFALAALALDLILGFGAIISFGHAAFIGIGAYAAGIADAHGYGDVAIALPAALAASALFAFATGTVSLRTRGVYLIMITLAFWQMAYVVPTSLKDYGGDDGLTLATRSTVFGAGWLENDLAFHYVTLAILAAFYLLCRVIVVSRFGRVLAGIRENPERMRAIGYDPYPYQLTAYVIAGMIASVAGFLLANQAEFVSPSYMSWQRSGELIMMVVLGGVGSLHGAILGAGVYLLAQEYLARLTEHWRLIFGPFLVLAVLFANGGLTGLLASLRLAKPNPSQSKTQTISDS
jgi:branched-chain amino acid transport system permease protein